MDNNRHSGGRNRWSIIVLAAVAAWFAVALALVSTGFVRPAAGQPPLGILLAATAPVLAFLAWYAGSRGFREWVLGLDLRLLVMFQGWRVLGGEMGSWQSGWWAALAYMRDSRHISLACGGV